MARVDQLVSFLRRFDVIREYEGLMRENRRQKTIGFVKPPLQEVDSPLDSLVKTVKKSKAPLVIAGFGDRTDQNTPKPSKKEPIVIRGFVPQKND